MSAISTTLLQWADELDSGRRRQIRGQMGDGHGGSCAVQVFFLSGGSVNDLAAVQAAVVEEVHRRIPCTNKRTSIVTLNDDARIPFSIFAQAARSVAYREQEQSFGRPVADVPCADLRPGVPSAERVEVLA